MCVCVCVCVCVVLCGVCVMHVCACACVCIITKLPESSDMCGNMTVFGFDGLHHPKHSDIAIHIPDGVCGCVCVCVV